MSTPKEECQECGKLKKDCECFDSCIECGAYAADGNITHEPDCSALSDDTERE